MAITRLAKTKAFSKSAKDFMEREGIAFEDVYEALALGERTQQGVQFNNLTIRLTNNVVEQVFLDQRVTSIKCGYCRDTKKQKVYNECGRCNGLGCKRCNRGFIPTYIPCQTCKGKPYALAKN